MKLHKSKYLKNKSNKRISTVFVFFLIFLPGNAQIDTFEQFYHYNNNILIENFEREHIPLNGKNVTMIPFRKDELYGFVTNDEKHNWIIQPEYEQVFAVYPEGAIVKKDRYGLINVEHKWLIQPQYENLIKEQDIFMV